MKDIREAYIATTLNKDVFKGYGGLEAVHNLNDFITKAVSQYKMSSDTGEKPDGLSKLAPTYVPSF
jgi:hypothetical protein